MSRGPGRSICRQDGPADHGGAGGYGGVAKGMDASPPDAGPGAVQPGGKPISHSA